MQKGKDSVIQSMWAQISTRHHQSPSNNTSARCGRRSSLMYGPLFGAGVITATYWVIAQVLGTLPEVASPRDPRELDLRRRSSCGMVAR
eukprot:scaffold20544_cov31-Tisochrysis_lutea.AAC.4